MPALPVVAGKVEETVVAATAVAPEVEDDVAAPGAALTKNQKKRLKEKEAKARAIEAALKQVTADPASAALSDAEKLERATAIVAAAKAAAKAETEPEAAAADDEDPTNPYPRVGKSYKRQTWPEPTVPVRKQFSPGAYPKGEEMPHPLECNAFRVTSEEKRAMERLMSSRIGDLRQAAEVHRQVRTWARSWIKPGIPLLTITDRIEKKLEELIGKNGLKAGQAFPTGVSLNHIAAHYTSNSGDKTIYGENDVLKVDFGTQINGHIIDCAWTEYTNPRYDPLAEAVKAATNEGLKQAGIDVRLGDIGAAIQEVMESYEVELDGKTYRVKSINNLSGHSIDQYVIHGGKSVPIVKRPETTKMEEGELYAIETFGSTGRGSIVEDGECSHYMARPGAASSVSLRSDGAKSLMKHIDQQYGTLAFCRKWLDQKGHDRHMLYLKQIVDSGAVNPYPPLVDVKGSYTAQMEHTILMKPTGKEVLSRGLDY